MLSIIVPCYNEEASLPLYFKQTREVVSKLALDHEFIFIDDGSTDDTLQVIRDLANLDSKVRYLSFSRNFGKEAAIFAGLKAATGSYVTLMDADLQDPPELLPQMLQMIQEEGYDCVGTRRSDRHGEPKVRSFFAKIFYHLINRISDTHLVEGARDFRLMTRQMVDAVLELTEYNRFSKGLFSWVGFKTTYIPFENQERVAGKTSWSFWSLFKYSLDGIVNFSEAPLNIASFVGALSCLGSAIALVFIVIRALLYGDPTAGWPSMVSIFLFVGGLQLLCLGIIGKYIGKIFLETKNRPIYIVKETDQKEDQHRD